MMRDRESTMATVIFVMLMIAVIVMIMLFV